MSKAVKVMVLESDVLSELMFIVTLYLNNFLIFFLLQGILQPILISSKSSLLKGIQQAILEHC